MSLIQNENGEWEDDGGGAQHLIDLPACLRAAIHEESTAIAPRTSSLIEVARDAANEIERLRGILEWQHQAISDAITENGLESHRLLLDGEYHTGPVVDWCHTVLTGLASIAKNATHE